MSVRQPLTNVQLELLKTFSHQLSDSDMQELRKVLAQFFAKRLIEQADQTWMNQGWNDDTLEKMLNTKMRKKSKSA